MAHLVFQTAFLGDLFLSIPLIKNLRKAFPKDELVLACRPRLGEFFLATGLVDQVIEIDKSSSSGRSQALRDIQRQLFEHVLCPHESVRTAFWMSRLNVSGQRVGFRKFWNAMAFDQRIVKNDKWPDALRQLSLLTPLNQFIASRLNLLQDSSEFDSPTLMTQLVDFRSQSIPQWADMYVPPLKHVTQHTENHVFLAPGSVWNTKRWLQAGYEQLADKLVQRGMNVILVGSPEEHSLCEAIRHRVPQVINMAGQYNILQTVDAFRSGRALVSNDSGAMHLAAAAGLPTVAIFGPTTLSLGFRPWQQQAMVVQSILACRPCGKHGAEVCPLGTHECMTSVSVASVLRALEQLLTLQASVKLDPTHAH